LTGKAFHVKGLGWEEWMWCIFLGFSELVWGQLVLTIPKNSFPKLCRFGTKELPLATIVEPDGPKDSKARLLWIRGLTRLQHQVSYHRNKIKFDFFFVPSNVLLSIKNVISITLVQNICF